MYLLRGQLQYFATNGYRVVLISGPGLQVREAAEEQGVQLEEVKIKRDISPINDLLALLRIIHIILIHRPHIVNTGTPKAGLLVGIAAWLCRVPQRYFTLRGIRSDRMTGFAAQLVRWAEITSCRVATQIIAVSPSLLQHARNIGIVPHDRGLVIHNGSSNGVDSNRFSRTSENVAGGANLRSKLGIPARALVIGFVGRLSKDKGISELLDAFGMMRTEYPEARLLLVGPMEDAQYEAIVSDELIYWLDQTDSVEHVYAAIDILVLPSYGEGFGNVLLEAAAMQLPVIASDITGCRDAVEDQVTGLLVPVRNAKRLAEAMVRLANEPEYRQRLGFNGRENAVKNFASEDIWRGLHRLYISDSE